MAVVRLQALDGVWQTIGSGSLEGLAPENLQLSSNEWGADKATFDLHRDPGIAWPDLAAFTPVEVDVAGELVWTGRISETPARDGDDPIINVQAEGWQYHLDDDTNARLYVRTDLQGFQDARSLSTSNLALYPGAGTVSNDKGVITLLAPQGQPFAASAGVAVVLDLGPNLTAKRVVANVTGSHNASTAWQLFIVGSDVPSYELAPLGNGREYFVSAIGNGTFTTSTFAGTTTSGHRYITLLLFNATGAPSTPTADIYFRFNSILIFSDPSYESGNASILKASDVAKDPVEQALTPLLSSDTSQVVATTFVIPELYWSEQQTRREALTAVNAFHNFIQKVDVQKRLVFQPRPSMPKYMAGAWSNYEYADASIGSGADVYNKTVVEGTGPDGTPMSVQVLGASTQPYVGSSVTVPNPSFTFDTSGWINSGGGGATFTRDTSVFDTAPASLRVDIPANTGAAPQTAASGTLMPGRIYRVRVKAKIDAAANFADASRIWLQVGAQTMFLTTLPSAAGFTTYEWVFTVASQTSGFTLTLSEATNLATAGKLWVDSITIEESLGTIVDKQGFIRSKSIPIDASLTAGAATQIGQTFLDSAKTQPLKGSMTLTGPGIQTTAGQPVPPANLLRDTGELIRLTDRIDPDTGGIGRDAMIATVTWTEATDEAVIELDNGRRNFEAYLSRLNLVMGQVRG